MVTIIISILQMKKLRPKDRIVQTPEPMQSLCSAAHMCGMDGVIFQALVEGGSRFPPRRRKKLVAKLRVGFSRGNPGMAGSYSRLQAQG